ncbi:retinitis pigmentosa 1-like 1 protein [Rhinichthys klamathensis goyatoka]|uniref:retinitis pigmentosa 1-like 1 protein n=1 Tax=Rhinichthys klamathensis goyatoka TaxID=3034132 RepID=UPI0024B52615|nr:retinitis pigmentosa 1-like 1 protein [Rhinichthys klamathensis goyatoka]
MQRAAPGSFDADTLYQNEQFPHPPVSSFGSSVKLASPAKRITFYKSGDAQFKGVKMAIHKRSFKCFDALLDDLSQKVPLPFGVRTITTPRGTHSIKHLEQFEDGGCYLCSDRRYVKPINIEAAGKRPAVWHHHSHPHNTRRKPSRPEEPPSGHQQHHRHPKRIVLVKNNDPAIRRSIILSRRTARSLRVFMDEISELMQCHVKKLYTLEGRKIDSIQSLMQCPSVLVCVGREPFRPLLMESLKKLSDEKLPGMRTRSHSSICSEGHESKKNVNFGLETKKSIIHPRSDSSNRSTRFSLSSEKSYQNGVCMTPGQSGCVSTCPYVKEAIVNDDIEKRVLVNKDGSLSVEMKVRFRLFNDETLQWSTEIKKSSKKVNDSGFVKDGDYLQAKAEYSDPDSLSASEETDEAFATKLHQKHLEESLCQNCCNHCQEYDIWKNPIHKDPGACKSPSSSGSTHRVVSKKSSVDSMHTISRSSGEYTEHVVEKASCFQQTMEEGDTRVEYCAVSHCCNRSEVSSAGITSKSKRSCEDSCESHIKSRCSHTEPEISSTPHCAVIKVMEERPITAVSNSSKVLESLKEDQDDDYDELPPSISRVSHWSQSDHLESDDQPNCVHCCGCQTLPRSYLSPRPPSKESSSVVHSLKLKKYKTTFAAPVEQDGMSTTSPVSKVSSRSHPSHCGAITPSSVSSAGQHRPEGRACSTISRHSQASCKSRDKTNNPESNASDALEGDKSESAATQNHTTSDNHCEQDTEFLPEVRSTSAMSNKSDRSSEHPSHTSEQTTRSVKSCCDLQDKASPKSISFDVQCEPETEVTTEERLSSSLSKCSKTSVKSNASSKHSHTESKSKERVNSAMSCRSCKSNHNFSENTVTSVPHYVTPDECADPKSESERAASTMSQTSEKSNACSERSVKSGAKSPAFQEVDNGKSMTQNALTVTTPLPRTKRSPSPRSNHDTKIKTNSRATSRMSVSSNVSSQSQRSSKCNCHSSSSGNLRETNPEKQKEDAKDESEESLSGKSKLSAKSLINNIKSSGNQFDEPLSPTSTASVSIGLGEEHKGDDFDERSISGMSATTEDGGHKIENVNGVDAEERPNTEVSVNSAISDRPKKSHHMNYKTPVQALSPVSAESIMSAELKKSKSGSQLNENNIRVPSTLSLSSLQSKTPSRVSQGSSKNTVMKGRDCEALNNTNHAEMTKTSSKHDQSETASGKATPASDCLHSSIASERSMKSKNGQSTRENDKRSKGSSQCLEINGLNIKYNCDNDRGMVKCLKSSSSERRSVKNDTSRANSAVMSDISQNCRSLPQEMPNKKKTSVKHPDSSSNSVLSQALSAADLLREIIGNARPVSRGSKSVASSKNVDKVENKSQKSSRSKHEEVSVSLECNNKELMPSFLPNASPTEVVNDWLRKIPIEGHVYEMDVELTEYMNLAQGDEDTSQTEKKNAPESIIEVEEPQEDQAGENYIQQETNDSCCEKAQLETYEMFPDPEALTKQDCLQKQCHSSVQVMKVLLGPKLDRSSSLPEVSPAYGRKLSQSAQGLLDCLANLRLIDSDSKNEKQRKYNEIMMILQSLWLQKPSEDEQKKQNKKEHHFAEDEFNPRSSSGVDVSSGSTGSVKGSMNGIVGKIETTHGTIPPIAEQEASVENKGEEENEEKSTAPACECLDPSKVLSDPVTPDIAERVQGSPVNTQLDDDKENGILHEEDVESSDNKKESDQTPQTSSGNESNTMKSQENTSSGSQPSVQRAPLIKRVSQDPDPVWVLNLLKKLEKQFMLHYADAMAEFKVRWDLDDNEMLDTMISELKEEVHKRIQSSIHRELQKIQSRAGRCPRPPGNTLSRESTVQTEQRRKRLRVMRNKSITMSRDEENYTASGTEYSDQRSDDEYCPCDACMKKKMASRAVQQAQALSLAPVMMEFDLRKILQMKKDPVKPFELKLEEQRTTNLTEENNLEVVHEEVEDTNDDTRGHDVETADQEEPDGALNAVDGENINNIKYVSLDSEKRDQIEEETNDKRESGDVEGGEDEEEKEGEHAKEVVNGDTEGKEEVEFVEEETEKGDTEEDGDEKNSLKGDAANSENSDVDAEGEKENEMTETGEETESGDNGAETETGEESTEDKSAEDGSESNKDNTTEGEKSDETPNEESASEKNADGSQDGTAKDDAEEDGTSNTGQDEDQPEEKANVPKVKIEVEVEGDAENEMDKCSSVEEDLKNDDQSDETVAVICESTLAKQVTRTSMESQPGSVENCTNQTAQAKLKDLQSFMESVDSQGDNMVVITKQPPYKESHGPGNLKDICNGLTEWQVSPKISNRANKQKNTKD